MGYTQLIADADGNPVNTMRPVAPEKGVRQNSDEITETCSEGSCSCGEHEQDDESGFSVGELLQEKEKEEFDPTTLVNKGDSDSPEIPETNTGIDPRTLYADTETEIEQEADEPSVTVDEPDRVVIGETEYEPPIEAGETCDPRELAVTDDE